MRYILLVLITIALIGCAPYMEIQGGGPWPISPNDSPGYRATISSYALKGTTTAPDGTKTEWSCSPEIPERWFSNVPKYVLDAFSPIISAYMTGKISLPAVPTTTPYPAPGQVK